MTKYEQECYLLSEQIRQHLNKIFMHRGISNFSAIPATSGIDVNQVNAAMKLAKIAHKGQVDKGGVDYIYHPLCVGSAFQDPLRRSVGFLHDTLEDTNVTADYLRKKGFDPRIIDAVVLLTRARQDDYFDYIHRVSRNPYAADIKLADLFHNSRADRLHNVTVIDVQRMQKYLEAIRVLGYLAWGCEK